MSKWRDRGTPPTSFGCRHLPNRAAIARGGTANSPPSHEHHWRNSRRRRAMRIPFGHVLAGSLLLWAAAPARAADLALQRVVLSTGGVGYLEYEAPVQGDAALTLDVPLDQV